MRQIRVHLTIQLVRTHLISILQLHINHVYRKSSNNMYYWSKGFVVTGYVVPGCVEDGTWMLWETSSAAAAVIVVLACSFLDNFSNKSSFVVTVHAHEACVRGYLFL